MSWSSRLFAIFALAGLLGACGFQPMYAKGERGDSVAELAQIRIERIPDRIGQQIKNDLMEQLSPRGEPEKPKYHLRVIVSVTKSGLGIRKDQTSTYSEVRVSASYSLFDQKNRGVVSGSAQATTSYNELEQVYASTVSEQTAMTRAAKEIAEEVRSQLGAFFASQHQPRAASQ